MNSRDKEYLLGHMHFLTTLTPQWFCVNLAAMGNVNAFSK